jgi:hypothetical protein
MGIFFAEEWLWTSKILSKKESREKKEIAKNHRGKNWRELA